MSNNKQSSVEFLQGCLSIHFTHEQQMQFDGLFQQAKVMHKKEITEAYRWGRYDSDKLVMSERFYREQYYNETFNTKEK